MLMFASTPMIVKETSSGFSRIPIQDEMFQRREIQCLGEITSASVNNMILQFRHLCQEDPKQEISLFINSPGGEVASELALYDVMQALPCPIRTVCVGTAASMSALLFVSGNTREILPHGRVMIHDPLINAAGGSALSLKAISDNLMQVRQTTAEILARHTGRSLEEIYEKTAADTYFSAEEAVEFGLADRIITSL